MDTSGQMHCRKKQSVREVIFTEKGLIGRVNNMLWGSAVIKSPETASYDETQKLIVLFNQFVRHTTTIKKKDSD